MLHQPQPASPADAQAIPGAADVAGRAAAAPAGPDAGSSLPPPGSYYEYAGQRVLVPEWPEVQATDGQDIGPALSEVLCQVLLHERPTGTSGMGKRGRGKGLSEWGKEVLLRIMAKVYALRQSDPEAYWKVSVD